MYIIYVIYVASPKSNTIGQLQEGFLSQLPLSRNFIIN